MTKSLVLTAQIRTAGRVQIRSGQIDAASLAQVRLVGINLVADRIL